MGILITLTLVRSLSSDYGNNTKEASKKIGLKAKEPSFSRMEKDLLPYGSKDWQMGEESL